MPFRISISKSKHVPLVVPSFIGLMSIMHMSGVFTKLQIKQDNCYVNKYTISLVFTIFGGPYLPPIYPHCSVLDVVHPSIRLCQLFGSVWTLLAVPGMPALKS